MLVAFTDFEVREAPYFITLETWTAAVSILLNIVIDRVWACMVVTWLWLLIKLHFGGDLQKYPYSRKPLREKTFVNFTDLCSATKVFSTNFGGRGMQHAAGIFGTCILKVPSIDMSLLKYFQTSSSLPKSDGPFLTIVHSSSIVAVNRQAWGNSPGHRHPSTEASPPRRWHGSENGPWSMVWQRQFTISLTNWSLNKSTCTMRTSPSCRCSEYRLVVCSFSRSAGYCTWWVWLST